MGLVHLATFYHKNEPFMQVIYKSSHGWALGSLPSPLQVLGLGDQIGGLLFARTHFLRPPTVGFLVFLTPQQDKHAEQTRKLRKAWCRFGSLANLGIFLPQILVAEKISPKTATWIMSKKPAILNLEFLFIFRLQPLVFWVPFWASRTWKTYTYTTDKWWIPLLYFTHLCFHLDQKYVDNAWIILCVGGQDMSRSTNG